MSKFNEIIKNTTTNLAGGKANKMSPELELFFSCATTFLEDKFYEKADDRMNRIIGLCNCVQHYYIAQLAVYCRNVLNLRSVTHLLVATLARIHRGDSLVRRTMVRIALRPDDLTEIVAILGKPIPNQVKKGIENALHNFTPYQLAKYKMGNKKVKLVDLFNLTHPFPCVTSKNKIQKDIVSFADNVKNAATVFGIQSLNSEYIKKRFAFNETERNLAWKKLIKNELVCTDTWESEVSENGNTAEVWFKLLSENKLGYMALLRNLRNIENHKNEKLIKLACDKLLDKRAIENSKVLPFRFITAYDEVTDNDILEAIEKALEISLSNVPVFDGNTLVAIDSSGSMSGSGTKKDSLFRKAALLGVSLFAKNKADIICFSNMLSIPKLLRNDSFITNVNKLENNFQGGGTNTSLVFDFLKEKYDKWYSRVIIISDNESWLSVTQNKYTEYLNCVNKKELGGQIFFALDLAGYGTLDLKEDGKVFNLTGWNENIFNLMKLIEQKETILNNILKIRI